MAQSMSADSLLAVYQMVCCGASQSLSGLADVVEGGGAREA